MPIKHLHSVICVSAALLCSANAMAQQPVKNLAFTIYDFPPEIVNTAVDPQGPIIDKMKRILEKSGYRPDWILSSMTEETQMLDENQRHFCTTGRLYTPERGKKWRFIPYIMLNISSDAFLVRKENIPKFKNHMHISEVLADTALKGVFVNGGSYGKDINSILKTDRYWLNMKATSSIQTINMVQANRADYTIVPLKTWVSVIDKNSGHYDLVNLTSQIKGTQDSPEPIYMACSKSTPITIVQDLSDAMGTLGFAEPTIKIDTDIVIKQSR